MKLDAKWAQIQGLMLSIAIMHAEQPIAAGFGELPWKSKMFVSIAGAILYSICGLGLVGRKKWALWIAVIGPFVGLTAVVGGYLAGYPIQPDVFEVMGGIVQVLALVRAVQILKE